MSRLPALAQWAGLATIIVGGFLTGPGPGVIALGFALLLIGWVNEVTE